MVFSMTAFARCSYDGDAGRYTWEIRSVNHRFAEVFIRMPEEFRGLESELRTSLLNRLKRGKIDCNLKVEPHAQTQGLIINEQAVQSVVAATKRINSLLEDARAVDPIDVLKWPGVLDSQDQDLDSMSREIRTTFDEALELLLETRQREGEKLSGMVEQRCIGVGEQIELLRERVPEIIALTTQRFQQRLQDRIEEVDKNRLEQECALLAQKLDVAEELDRLEAHLQEVLRVLHKGSPAGRRLDFLMQELNRESNTIGAKSSHIDSSSASVELKVLIEQMREQIQNIE